MKSKNKALALFLGGVASLGLLWKIGKKSKDDIPGCMNPNADNYNPDATEDDGSCEYPQGQGVLILRNIHEWAANWTPDVSIDGVNYGKIQGATEKYISLPVGQHAVTISARGNDVTQMLPGEFAVDISDGCENRICITIHLINIYTMQWVKINCESSDVTITIVDSSGNPYSGGTLYFGTYQGEIPASGVVVIHNVPMGAYWLGVRYDEGGYDEMPVTVTESNPNVCVVVEDMAGGLNKC